VPVVPGSYQADHDPGPDRRATACGSNALEAVSGAARRRAPGAPKFIYTVPELPETRPGSTPPRPTGGRRLVENRSPRARDPDRRGTTPLRPPSLRGARHSNPPLQATTAAIFVIYVGNLLEDPFPPASGSAGAVAPPPVMEKIVLGKQATDLCTSTLSQYFRRRVLRVPGQWGDYGRQPDRDLPRAARTAMLDAASSAIFRRPATWEPAGGRAVSAGRLCRIYIDTTRPAGPRAWRRNVAFRPPAPPRFRRPVPAARARCASTSLRPRTEEEIVEGIRRIGEVVTEQVSPLRPRLRGSHSKLIPPQTPAAPGRESRGGGRRGAPVPEERHEGSQYSKGGGRSSRQVVAFDPGRPGRGRGFAKPLGTNVGSRLRRRRRPRPPAQGGAPRRRPSWPLHGRRGSRTCNRPGAPGDPRHPVHGARASPPAAARPTKSPPSMSSARGRHPHTPELGSPSTSHRLPASSGAGRRARGDRVAARFSPLVVQGPARGWIGNSACASPQSRADVPEALLAAFSYDDRVDASKGAHNRRAAS